jgi:hypothetical protein
MKRQGHRNQKELIQEPERDNPSVGNLQKSDAMFRLLDNAADEFYIANLQFIVAHKKGGTAVTEAEVRWREKLAEALVLCEAAASVTSSPEDKIWRYMVFGSYERNKKRGGKIAQFYNALSDEEKIFLLENMYRAKRRRTATSS